MQRMIVTRVTPDGSSRRPDQLIVEEPMTIQLDGEIVSTTMRTPGNDFELAAGFCFTEGLLDRRAGHRRAVLRQRLGDGERVQRRHRRDR